MKKLAVACGVLMLAVWMAGCNRSDQAGQPVAYDPQLDGTAPGPPALHIDPRNTTLRAMIAAIEERGKQAVPLLPQEDPIAEAKQATLDLVAVAKAEDRQTALRFFAEEEAAIVGRYLDAMETLPAKMQSLETLIRDRLGLEIPEKMKESLSAHSSMDKLNLLKSLGDTSVEDCTFETAGKTVVVTSKTGNKMTLAKVQGTWKIHFSPNEKEQLDVLADLFAATTDSIGALIKAIRDGSITKENFEAEAGKLLRQHLEAPMKKFMELIARDMTEGMQEAFAKPSTSATTPTPEAEVPAGPTDSETSDE